MHFFCINSSAGLKWTLLSRDLIAKGFFFGQREYYRPYLYPVTSFPRIQRELTKGQLTVYSLLKRQAGFTLIELLIVIAIIGILATVAIAKFSDATDQAKTKTWEYNSSIVNRAYALYRAMPGNSYVPADNETGVSFLSGFLSSTLQNGDLPGGTCTWARSSTDYAVATCIRTGSVAAVAALFSSTFDSLVGVNKLSGTAWTASGGSLVAPTTGTNQSVFAGSYGTNYDITANVEYLSGQGYGIYYHITSPQGSETIPTTTSISGYVFQFDHGIGDKFIIRQVIDGKESAPVATVSMSSVMPSGFSVTGTHQITMSVSGNTTVVSVDGTQVLSYTDAASTYGAGYVGLRTWLPVSGQTTGVNVQDLTVVAK